MNHQKGERGEAGEGLRGRVRHPPPHALTSLAPCPQEFLGGAALASPVHSGSSAEIRGSTGSRLNEPSGGGQWRGPHTGGTAPSLTPAQLPRSFIPRGESRRTNGPTPESAGRSGDGLKGGVGFKFFLKRIIGEGLFFPWPRRGGKKKEEERQGGKSGETQRIYLSTARQDKEVLTTV